MTDTEGRRVSEAARRFRELTRAHRAASDAALSRRGVREAGQPLILLFLLEPENGGDVTQKELTERLRVAPATITASLKCLERQGCVEREIEQGDNRRKRVRVTPRGREVAELCRCAFDCVNEAMFAGFDEEELAFLSSTFGRITKNLLALSGEGERNG